MCFASFNHHLKLSGMKVLDAAAGARATLEGCADVAQTVASTGTCAEGGSVKFDAHGSHLKRCIKEGPTPTAAAEAHAWVIPLQYLQHTCSCGFLLSSAMMPDNIAACSCCTRVLLEGMPGPTKVLPSSTNTPAFARVRAELLTCSMCVYM
eukprot:scaffold220769_cov21-Tisochrysis_lutea.AAC.2